MRTHPALRHIAATLAAGWLAACALVTPAAAEIYRWKDAGGREHFTTDPSQVPPGAATSTAGGGNVNTFSAPARPAPAAPGAGPKASDAAAAAPAAAGELRMGRDEAWWRKQREEHVSRIEQLEKQVAACPEVPRVPNPASPHFDRRAYDRATQEANDCSSARSSLQVSRTQLENFEETARKQDVPPGWLR